MIAGGAELPILRRYRDEDDWLPVGETEARYLLGDHCHSGGLALAGLALGETLAVRTPEAWYRIEDGYAPPPDVVNRAERAAALAEGIVDWRAAVARRAQPAILEQRHPAKRGQKGSEGAL